MDVDSELPFVHLNEPLLRSIQKRINKEGQKHKSNNFSVFKNICILLNYCFHQRKNYVV